MTSIRDETADIADMWASMSVPRFSVPRAVREAAEGALERASQALRIPLPSIVWLSREDLLDADGRALKGRPEFVYLASDLAYERAEFVASHECRHCWQEITARGWNDPEKDANEWAGGFTGYRWW